MSLCLSRPDPVFARAAFRLGLILGTRFEHGWGNPGGWILVAEPGIQFVPMVVVPDLAGWRQESYQAPRKGPFQVPPDWVYEVLSPSTAQDARARKMSIYGRGSVYHVWLLNPLLRTLEIFRRQDDAWLLVHVYYESKKIRAEPFEAIEIDLAQIWGETVTAEGDEAAD